MQSFTSIKEFIDALARESKLITELFDKRNLRVRYDDALQLTDDREDRLEYLVQRSVVLKNGEFIELDPNYRDFMEEILEVNAEINTAYIKDNIENIKANINFYLEETTESRKLGYLRKVKADIRKTGRTIIRNVIDLGRNIENTYKTEPNYKIKKLKLEAYDRKRDDIAQLTDVVGQMFFEQQQLFFLQATDEELIRIKHELRHQLHEGRHNLVEIQKQIIEYLNQVRRQTEFIEKLRRIKYLKDQFELKSKSDIVQALEKLDPVAFETEPRYPLKLSLEMLESDEGLDILKKVAAKMRLGKKTVLPAAPEFTDDQLNPETSMEVMIDKEEVKNSFAASGRDLFSFVMQYDFPRQMDFGEKVTLYCQLISLYPEVMELTDDYSVFNDVEYVMVYPK
jgi:hypothetical protein